MAEPPTVVVGGGVAGGVAASVLAARGERVIVLEAGPPEPAGRAAEIVNGPDYLAALSVPGRVWAGVTARRTPDGAGVPYLIGRGVGGGAAVNGGLVGADVPAWLPVEEVDAGSWGVVDRAVAAAATGWVGARVSPARFARARGRRALVGLGPGVEVRPGALVDRIVFAGRRAVAVRLDGGEQVAAARVVLAAGALLTPAILRRSGVDRPGIGANLRDHLGVALVLRLHAGLPANTGPTTGCVVDVDPGVQLVPLNSTGAGTAAVLAMCLHSRGTGHVRVRSDDPHAVPEIEFDLLGDDRDRAEARAAVRYLADLGHHPAVTAIAAHAGLGSSATSLDLAGAGDDEIDRWLAGAIGDVYHAAGTCRMGARDDADAVVDSTGAVLGAEGLYVVDASVLPELPPAPPMATIAATAHRLASGW